MRDVNTPLYRERMPVTSFFFHIYTPAALLPCCGGHWYFTSAFK